MRPPDDRLAPLAHLLGPFIWVSFAAIFWADVVTTADNVSICFAYCIPIVLSLLERPDRCFVYAGIATALSLIGSFFQPPLSTIGLISFASNRAIAIGTQWLVAALVRYQRRLQVALQSRVEEEQEKVEQQRRLTDVLSHEIGSALTTIGGHAFRLAKLAQLAEPSDVVRRAGKIQGSVERIKAVVDRIQLAAGLNGSNLSIERRSIKLYDLLEGLVQQLDDEHQGRIRLELSRGSPRIEGDEVLLARAFENLIENSIRYARPNTPIVVQCRQDRACIAITVKDQGNGIEPDDLPRLAAAYFRGKNSRGTRGTGLGLYLVEQIVRAHGGSVTISSARGEGSTVMVELPATSDAVRGTR